MKRFDYGLYKASILVLLLVAPLYADELQVSEFNGSALVGEHISRFTTLPVLTGPMDGGVPTKIDLEGSLKSRIFERPEGVSALEIVRSYSQVLKADGFELLLSCEKQKNNCKRGYVTVGKTYQELFRSREYGKIQHDTGIWLLSYAHHYLAAKKQTADGLLYVVIIASDKKNLYMIDSLKVDVMADGNVEISAKILNDKISTDGKVVLSGIFFETGKNTVSNKSKPSLITITQYLNENPKYFFYVVGHTDDTGDLDSNILLSRKRAQAVVEELKQLGVNESRLIGQGVGPFSPTSSNASDRGRAENRRVELVLRVK